ncbi:MAG: ATP-binding protein, partial [Rhodothermales bacterium]
MYLDFFQLREHPFRLTPDLDFLFMSRGHTRAKAYMDYTVVTSDGFVVVTGEIGSGKTTLLKKLVSELPDDVVVAKIEQTQLTDVEFLRAVLAEFGRPAAGAVDKVELLGELKSFLYDCFRMNRQVVLLVDEAQLLSERVLEEIRLISGIETNGEKILSVVLAGQPELERILELP